MTAVLLLLLLAACSPLPSDPASLRSMASGYERGTQSAAEATQEARYYQAQQATEAGRATDRAIALQVTGLALTERAHSLNSTEFSGRATAYMATLDASAYAQNYLLQQTKRVDELNFQRSQDKRLETMKWSGTLLCSSTLALAAILAFSFGMHGVDAWYRQKRATIDIVSRPWQAALPAPQVVDHQPKSVQEEIVDFLQAAVQVNGAEAKQVPSDDRLGMSSEKWQLVTGTLEYHGCIVVVPSRGTYVRDEYGNLGGLLRIFTTHQTVIRRWHDNR